MRILCWPFRSPLSAFNRLLGGTASSANSRTRFSCVSLRASTAHGVEG